MPFAAANKISQTAFDGAIEITGEQYTAGLEAVLNGQEIVIINGEFRILSLDVRAIYNKATHKIKMIAENSETPEDHTILAPPSDDHEWLVDQWIITPQKQAEIDRRALLVEIELLEAQQTPRRIREAALGQDNGWLADLEAQIEILRLQLENIQ